MPSGLNGPTSRTGGPWLAAGGLAALFVLLFLAAWSFSDAAFAMVLMALATFAAMLGFARVRPRLGDGRTVVSLIPERAAFVYPCTRCSVRKILRRAGHRIRRRRRHDPLHARDQHLFGGTCSGSSRRSIRGGSVRRPVRTLLLRLTASIRASSKIGSVLVSLVISNVFMWLAT